jgi:hypothetical protein
MEKLYDAGRDGISVSVSSEECGIGLQGIGEVSNGCSGFMVILQPPFWSETSESPFRKDGKVTY